MLLTHEQAHAAYKIMELANAGGAGHCSVRFGSIVLHWYTEFHTVDVFPNRGAPESHASLSAFAHAYDIDGCATLEKYRAAVADWHAFCVYHAAKPPCADDQITRLAMAHHASQPPCTREKFDSLSPAGRLTKMILGVWA